MSNVVSVLEQTQKATIIRFTDNHALVAVASNSFSTEPLYVYVNKVPLSGMAEQDEFELPAGKLVTKTDSDGDVMTNKQGIPLKFYVA